MNYHDLTIILASTVALSTPILLAAVGGLISERAGVFALTLEGFMLMGAFFSVFVAMKSNASVGVLAGGLAGMGLAVLYAVFSIRLKMNQITACIGLIILAMGLTKFLNDATLERAGTTFQRAPGLAPVEIPLLSDIPVIGTALFAQNWLVYASFGIAAFTIYFLNRSHAGLRLAAVGHAPRVAEARGISVNRTRYAAVLVSGFIGGIAGAMLTLGILNSFVANVTAGRGFIALAAIVFAAWRPSGVVLGALLFGGTDALQLWLNSTGAVALPADVLSMMPYVLAIVVLMVFASEHSPAALGLPYDREQRN